MSLFRRVLNLDQPASPDLPVEPGAPLPQVPAGETASVRRIAARLGSLPPARARFVAAFAYLLGRAAHADLVASDAEAAEMRRLVAEVGGLDHATANLVTDLARSQAGDFGATEDYLVTREFKAIATMDERERLLRCCFVVMAADDEVDATESWLANRLAEELDIERPDLNRIRAEFHDRISGVRDVRRYAAS
ncbi:MAG: hypothetical protein A2V85_12160 [Chloroflexi bacterium RBG_16_72_14]|nr:MAG: hypothetical protein A2V85_12160 [Chloroflexi bacterium RBG_16_72_14]